MRNKHKNPYSKLSRKELQNLCKKYGLPAIGPSPHLAGSLFSLFKESNLDPLGKAWDVNATSKQSDIQSDVGKGWDVNSASKQSNMHSDGRINCLEGDKTCFQVLISEENGQDISFVGKTSETCLQTISSVGAKSIDAQPPDVANGIFDAGRSKDSLICSTSVMRATDLPDLLASVSTSCGVGRCSTAIDDGHLNDGNHLSTKESHGQLPSFQFFAESNDGINICIDLSSSPSKWIKSLKDQVQLFQNESLEVVHGAYEPVNTTCRETGSIQQKHENKKYYHPFQMDLIALENPIKTTHVRQMENGSFPPTCSNSVQRKSSSNVGRDLQAVTVYSDAALSINGRETTFEMVEKQRLESILIVTVVRRNKSLQTFFLEK